MRINFRDVIEFLFLPILTAGVFVLWDLNKNVNDLNVRVGVLIATNTSNERQIEELKKRIEKLEDRFKFKGGE